MVLWNDSSIIKYVGNTQQGTIRRKQLHYLVLSSETLLNPHHDIDVSLQKQKPTFLDCDADVEIFIKHDSDRVPNNIAVSHDTQTSGEKEDSNPNDGLIGRSFHFLD